MKHLKKEANNSDLLHHFGRSSRNIIQHHDRDNVSEFLLHDLCSTDFFNIKKAAYLINNPDFSCIKGVVGYHQPEKFETMSWDHPKEFTAHMQKSPYNKQVRSYRGKSFAIQNSLSISQDIINSLADHLEIDPASSLIWLSKHNNQGIFVFDIAEKANQKDLHHFIHLLSFCPIF